MCPIVAYVGNCLNACPSDTYENNGTCFDCPAFCQTCISETHCSSCLSGASIYNNLCYTNCPAEAPFSVSSVCKKCNVVSCYECSGTDCIQC